MKKIRVSLNDETYRRVKARAAELGASVSVLVAKHLVELSNRKTIIGRSSPGRAIARRRG